MKLGLIFLAAIPLMGCASGNYDPIIEQSCDDAGVEAAPPPRNEANTDGGICCQITNNFQNDPIWNNGFYTCVLPDAALQPFNPPWICNVTFDGQCGGDSGLDCLTCFDPTCVVGMRCLDVNGTGTVIPCN